jgi:hypothetical protein
MPRKTKPNYASQPAVAAFLKLLTRARGATITELQAVNDTEPHTCRAVLSRMRSVAGLAIEIVKEARGNVYRVVAGKAERPLRPLLADSAPRKTRKGKRVKKGLTSR